jgi:opacity protein-like surface antigen
MWAIKSTQNLMKVYKMKKIILTTVAVAALTSSAFAAQTGQTYLKGGLGYGLTNAKGIIPESTGNFKKEGKKPRGFTGVIGAGYMLNDMLGVEAFVDYTSADAKNKKIKNNDNLSSKFTETSIGLGGKVFVQHTLAEKFSVNAGVGAGVAFKSAKHKFSEFTAAQKDGGSTTAAKTESVELASKNITQPFGLVSLGADYTISDGVAVGVEYAVKFNGKKDYKTKKDITGTDAEKGGLPNEVIAKGSAFAKTSKINQAIMANVKFAL